MYTTGLVKTVKAFRNPALTLPLFFCLLGRFKPVFVSLFQFVFLGKGNWSTKELAVNELVLGVSNGLFLLAVLGKLKKLTYSYLILAGIVLYTLSVAGSCAFLFVEHYPRWFAHVLRFVVLFIQNFGFSLLLVPIVGRISKFLPKGFENTGVTVVLALYNASWITEGIISGKIIQRVGIKNGYYERAQTPLLFGIGSRVVLIFLSPIFLKWL